MKKLILLIGFASLTMNAQVPSYVPTIGLVGYWPFSGNANDISTNGNNGVNNGATLTTDRFGNANSAYSFNGTSNFIELPDTPFDFGTGNFSMSVWINRGSSTNYGGIISKERGDASTGQFRLFVSDGFYANAIGKEYFFISDTNNNFLPQPTIPNGFNLQTLSANTINQWVHFIVVRNLSNYYFYQNGQLIASSTAPLNLNFSNNQNLRIGARYSSTGTNAVNFFNGKIDDFAFWNRALTQDEITTLYQAEVSCQSLVINSGTLSSYNPPVYQSTITIYPNPANDHITIDCGTLANVVGYHIEIVNTIGQVVFNQPMNTQQYYVPLNTWSGTGVYFVKIYDSSNNLLNTKKIILQ